MARTVSIPHQSELHQAVIELLRQKGSRLLSLSDIHERLNDSDSSQQAVERAVNDLELSLIHI